MAIKNRNSVSKQQVPLLALGSRHAVGDRHRWRNNYFKSRAQKSIEINNAFQVWTNWGLALLHPSHARHFTRSFRVHCLCQARHILVSGKRPTCRWKIRYFSARKVSACNNILVLYSTYLARVCSFSRLLWSSWNPQPSAQIRENSAGTQCRRKTHSKGSRRGVSPIEVPVLHHHRWDEAQALRGWRSFFLNVTATSECHLYLFGHRASWIRLCSVILTYCCTVPTATVFLW